MSGNDLTKHEIVLDKAASAVFTHLSYIRDYNAEQARIIKQSYKLK